MVLSPIQVSFFNFVSFFDRAHCYINFKFNSFCVLEIHPKEAHNSYLHPLAHWLRGPLNFSIHFFKKGNCPRADQNCTCLLKGILIKR